jgi:signal transduction histidine kinase
MALQGKAMQVRWGLEIHKRRGPALGYGSAILYVAMALGLSLAAQHLRFRDVALPLLCLAIAVTTWSQGLGPGALAVLLSTACFAYFFAEPIYSFYVYATELPYFFTFLLWALIVAYFAALQRRIDQDLRDARDHLQVEVDQRRRREEEVTQLNQELGRRASELETANKELEAFAYSVSHDLRAPLRHVVGFAELLQKQASSSLDEKARRYIKIIQDSTIRMATLIDDLLNFSRIGRAETNKVRVNLKELVSEVVASFVEETSGRDIVWTIGTLPTCRADRSMLKLVLANLISNAVKFTRRRARSEIEIGSTRLGPDRVEVFVKDNGAGFDMRYYDKLFGVFQRLHASEEFDGTGIGLATVQRIIHRHGGNVRAEGARDRGATFYFSLPAG